MGEHSVERSCVTAVVTGASGGIGRWVAARLANAGYGVWAIARGSEPLEGLATSDPSKPIHACTLDLSSADTTMLSKVVSGIHGPLGAVVHCAGTIQTGSLATADPSDVLKIMRSNALGPLALTALLLPLLAPGGTIVFINSSQGLSARKGAGAYAASKHALRAIADALRADLDGRGIRVTSIYPGRTATPMQQGLYASRNEPYHPELLLQPETIADLVLWVVSLPPAAEVTDVSLGRRSGHTERWIETLRQGPAAGEPLRS